MSSVSGRVSPTSRKRWSNCSRAALGREPHTPLEAAVETTLDALGCLHGRAPRAAPSVR
ncbi:conserved hypothetical protein [Burkholderia thailandensis E264]|uniref:Uncharacterized protein n=1 Tax=Burkholderia thailandensis (strain ATCC 700388 / DSM 13276 / CCUG 48851 / CIP 106301 / E264) TaxID=271848 RepID=Q2T823_BURTA|nr:conserved hypothetical protein [Burkholderia thailandensis E264]